MARRTQQQAVWSLSMAVLHQGLERLSSPKPCTFTPWQVLTRHFRGDIILVVTAVVFDSKKQNLSLRRSDAKSQVVARAVCCRAGTCVPDSRGRHEQEDRSFGICLKTTSFRLHEMFPTFTAQKYGKHVHSLPSHVFHNLTDFHHVPAQFSSSSFKKCFRIKKVKKSMLLKITTILLSHS